MNRLTTSAYTTATAAASVAVKIPPKIPPRMMTGISSAQIPLLKVLATSLAGIFSWAGRLYRLPYTSAYPIRQSTSIRPGITEPMNSLDTDTLVMEAYTISVMDGGMMGPRMEEMDDTATAKGAG